MEDPHDPRPKPALGEAGFLDPPTKPYGETSPPPPAPPEPLLAETAVAMGQLRPGQMLGQYQIVEQLGSGGMGHVFKALHPAMQRTVALKVIAPELTQNAQARARFRREVRSAARLHHPNVVIAYDAAEAEGLWFLVMEYVPGTDAARLCKRHGRPPVALACEVVRQAALGLQHAHELGMVHRDIKPANLMVAWGRGREREPPPDGWPNPPLVKILDFGLARLAAGPEAGGSNAPSAVTRQGAVIGTPEYMAPEQARDSRLADIRSDIYSLGCTLYALLAGQPPFVRPTAFETIALHMNQPPDPISQYCPVVPARLEQVVMRALAKEPADRYATPLELANALEPWAKGIGMLPEQIKGVTTKPAANPAGVRRPAAAPPPRPPAVFLGDITALFKTMFLVAVLVLACFFVFEYWPQIVEFTETFSNKSGSPRSPHSPPGQKKGAPPVNVE
jgi:serine/threonine protein kinase